jgi:hypothetical protein
MKPVLAKSASLLHFGYSGMLVVIGAAGILTARWELETVFRTGLSEWPLDTQATMLNQYRFLKSVELGAGLFCFLYRPAILTGGKASALFLAIVGLGVLARTLSWIVDGRPATLFVVFLILEACVFIVVAMHLRIQHLGIQHPGMSNGNQRP